MQINHKTKSEYAGANADSLAHAQRANGYTSNEWLTFLQANELGLKVKKGSKSIRCIKVIECVDTKKNNERKAIRMFSVFNVEQCEKIAQ